MLNCGPQVKATEYPTAIGRRMQPEVFRAAGMSESKLSVPAVNADFIIDLYHRYIRDPQSVDPGWKPYFDDLYGRGDDKAPAARPGLEAAVTRLIEAYRQRGHFAAPP